jgi:hypothetical protein
MIVMSDRLRDFTGYREQDFPYKCPECNKELDMEECVGVGEYPQGGFRSSMRPNRHEAMGFECSACGTKSCFHADKYSKESYEDYQEIRALCDDGDY